MHPRKKLLYIGNKLAVHGHNPTGIDTLPSLLEREGYKVVTASSQKNKIKRVVDMVFTTIKNRNRVDLVLIDTYSTQNFYYAIVVSALCKLFKIPYIPILHGGNLPMRLRKNKPVSDRLFGRALTNVAPSKYMLRQFKEAGFHNITYIPNALEVENYAFFLREAIRPKLLWVRSFSEIYNPLLALEIVAILMKKEMDVSLCMVGPEKDGSLKRCKMAAGERNLPITFRGMLPKKEWHTLSKEYDIFINTTNFDNMPVSVMEAMALGMPVVSTNVGGLPFLLEDGKDGILVQPNNAEIFAGAVEMLCENPSLAAALSQNAREKMEQFDWQIVKQKWIALLEG